MKAKPIIGAVFASALLTGFAAAAGPAVVVEPVRANADRNWLDELRGARARAGAIPEAEARKLAAEMAASLQAELDKALRAQGFEVTAGGPGAVRLAATIEDLRVNAPESHAAGVRTYTREAGRATLRAQATDPSGAVLFKTEERAEAGDPGRRLQRASAVTNRFWFDAMFRSWAAHVARELRTRSP